MTDKCRTLTVYRIRDNIGGVPIEDFADVIAEPKNLITYDLTSDYDFEARLFVASPSKRTPPWVEFLEPGFGELSEVEESVTNSAVLVTKIKYHHKDYYFAFTFGFGRFLLKPNSYERNYGLRVALNTIYQTGTMTGVPEPARIRSVDAKTVAANTIHTRRQTDHRDTFETFGIDVQRDLLNAVTGQPVETKKWGTRITGAHALKLNLPVEIGGLGDLCIRIERASRRKDYQERFAWIDNIHTVMEPALIAKLEDRLLEKLGGRHTEGLELAPPELVAWDDISYFRFSIQPDVKHVEMNLSDYLAFLNETEKLTGLTIQQLRTGQKVEAVDGGNNVLHRWSVFKCISGELKLDKDNYHVNGGEFFKVADKYLSYLNKFIENELQKSTKILPPSVGDKKEDVYNELAAESSPNYLLLDKRTVRESTKTSPIEICDILTDEKHFIHVKRKLGSSSLSHLFAQGFVSGDLFLMSEEYRKKVFEEIEAAEAERADKTGDPSFQGRFSTFDVAGIKPSDYKIVYAIIAKWGSKKFVDALPFFSKVNLRHVVDDLHRMGYKVTYLQVEVK